MEELRSASRDQNKIIKRRIGGKNGVREGTWGGIANTKGHLRGCMKTYYSKSFLKCIIYILKKSKWNH